MKGTGLKAKSLTRDSTLTLFVARDNVCLVPLLMSREACSYLLIFVNAVTTCEFVFNVCFIRSFPERLFNVYKILFCLRLAQTVLHFTNKLN